MGWEWDANGMLTLRDANGMKMGWEQYTQINLCCILSKIKNYIYFSPFMDSFSLFPFLITLLY
jgi:hypothetical protein